MFAAFTTGVPVPAPEPAESVSQPSAYQLSDDAVVVDWLLPIATNILSDIGIECEAETVKECCSLRWCAMPKVGRLRTRRMQPGA